MVFSDIWWYSRKGNHSRTKLTSSEKTDKKSTLEPTVADWSPITRTHVNVSCKKGPMSQMKLLFKHTEINWVNKAPQLCSEIIASGTEWFSFSNKNHSPDFFPSHLNLNGAYLKAVVTRDCKSEYCLLCWTGKDGPNHWHSPCWNRIRAGFSRMHRS